MVIIKRKSKLDSAPLPTCTNCFGQVLPSVTCNCVDLGSAPQNAKMCAAYLTHTMESTYICLFTLIRKWCPFWSRKLKKNTWFWYCGYQCDEVDISGDINNVCNFYSINPCGDKYKTLDWLCSTGNESHKLRCTVCTYCFDKFAKWLTRRWMVPDRGKFYRQWAIAFLLDYFVQKCENPSVSI